MADTSLPGAMIKAAATMTVRDPEAVLMSGLRFTEVMIRLQPVSFG